MNLFYQLVSRDGLKSEIKEFHGRPHAPIYIPLPASNQYSLSQVDEDLSIYKIAYREYRFSGEYHVLEYHEK